MFYDIMCYIPQVIFQILTVASIKMAVIWFLRLVWEKFCQCFRVLTAFIMAMIVAKNSEDSCL